MSKSATNSPQKKGKVKRTTKIIIAIWAVFIGVVLSMVLVFTSISKGWIGYIPPLEELQNPKDKLASEIYSDDREVLGRFFQSKNNRVSVDYEDISPYLIQALIATEDVRYENHSGIDFKALVRAFVKRGILMQKSAGGGSTITQQLTKQLYSPDPDNMFERMLQKPQEWVMAVKLERLYTKEEIVNMYLNHFDFLNNAVGIKSAASVYFATTPAELKIEEAATLVGMCKNPSLYNPNRYNERSRGRRNIVLEQMEKAGYISAAQCDSLKQLPLELKFKKVDHKAGLAPYFREYLRLMMVAKKPERSNYRGWEAQKFIDDSISWETNPVYGWCEKVRKPDGSKYNIYTDGLKIYTTIDAQMQRYAEEAVREHLAGNLQPKFFAEKKGRWYAPFSEEVTEEEREMIMERAIKQTDRYRSMRAGGYSEEEIKAAFDKPVEMQLFSYEGLVDTVMSPRDSILYQKSFLRAGFMSMDPHTGYVKAYVGGIDFTHFQYNMVSLGRRQIGSTVKPFLYTLAMEEGFSPCDKFLNEQPTIITETGQTWTPRNASSRRIGDMVTLRWGLTNSNNWISARLMNELSPLSLVRLMHSFGIRSKIEPVLSLALGTADVSVEEMVTSYTAFVNRGIRVDPLYVTRIEDNNGHVISEFSPVISEVFSQQAYDKIVPILCNVIDDGTGQRIRRVYKIEAQMGGKTGTTNNNSDGWFMGFTPRLVSGVWVGGEERSIHFDGMALGQGASMALPIYGLFMQKVYADPELGYSEDEIFTFGHVDDCGEAKPEPVLDENGKPMEVPVVVEKPEPEVTAEDAFGGFYD